MVILFQLLLYIVILTQFQVFQQRDIAREQLVEKAVIAVLLSRKNHNSRLSLRKAERIFGVPKSTIHRNIPPGLTSEIRKGSRSQNTVSSVVLPLF